MTSAGVGGCPGLFAVCWINLGCLFSQYIINWLLFWDLLFTGDLTQNVELRAERQLGRYSLRQIGRFNVGGSRSSQMKPSLSRESPSLSHEEGVWPGIEPTTTGADVNFEHRSYHCATRCRSSVFVGCSLRVYHQELLGGTCLWTSRPTWCIGSLTSNYGLIPQDT
jgi:hypothetical protein